MCQKYKKMVKGSNKRKLYIAIFIFLLLFGLLGGVIYFKLYSPFFDIKETVYIYVDERKDFNDLLLQLETKSGIKDIDTFKKMAEILKYPRKMKTGRYAVSREMSCKQLLQHLIGGNQTPCRITFNNIRLKEDFAQRIGEQLMFGEAVLLQQLNDSSVCEQLGFDTNTILCMFIPNTYELYWNVSVEKFLGKMKSEYEKFWNQGRLKKAAEIPLSPVQVAILASVVEEETAAPDEYPIVAGLYINRLKSGMLLQADPTVKFAVGDFSIKRILDGHLEKDSPYNTYKYQGLPPGPIRIASIRGIDSVLDYSKHHYIYMCAKEDFSGRHNFSTTFHEHTRNAAKYRQALNRNNIR